MLSSNTRAIIDIDDPDAIFSSGPISVTTVGGTSEPIGLVNTLVSSRNVDSQSSLEKENTGPLEPRRVLAVGIGGNDCPPDLDLTGVEAQSISVGASFTLDILQSGGTVSDVDASGCTCSLTVTPKDDGMED